MAKIEKSIDLAGRKLTLSVGELAGQASGAVLASYGETVVLATVVAAPLKMELDYFPLSVDYQERLYAGGRIKGSRWVKREGKPTDEEILTARLIDRSIRPLFPMGYKKDVQVIVTVLSVDLENSPDVLSAVATSAAIAISSIPWAGPIGVVRVGMLDGKFVTNPLESELAKSDLDLIVSSTQDAVLMIESGGNEIPEKDIIEALKHAQADSSKIIKLIQDIAKEVKIEKEKYETKELSTTTQKKAKDLFEKEIEKLAKNMAIMKAGYADYNEIKKAVIDNFEDENSTLLGSYLDDLFKKHIRKLILSGKRLDGRKNDEIRNLSAVVSVLPRTHGSAIFNRGHTQALCIATLGGPSLEQLIETAEGEESKRYIHHYSMPPYSSGETGRIGSPNRREIGHGALAERALLPVIPSEEEFPYTIRVVTEILSSNGSTSMASTCGSTLSLMDAGVPIKSPVAGIAMGLVIEDEKNFKVLTDIAGIEDGNGDMDFKVAGTEKGITALQLDVKTHKLTIGILEEAIAQAKKARMEVLSAMSKAIDKPRSAVSKHAPNIKRIKIDISKIGELIGPGGKTIKALSSQTNSEINVDDDGTVVVSSISEEDLANAIQKVEAITKDVEAGEIYDGVVKRIQPFGAFIEVLPGKEGLVHVSEMKEDFVKNPEDVVSVGDKVQVRVKEIDELGRINLSMLLDAKADERKAVRSEGRGNNRYQGENRRGRDEQRGGPHFPTSRFIEERNKRRS